MIKILFGSWAEQRGIWLTLFIAILWGLIWFLWENVFHAYCFYCGERHKKIKMLRYATHCRRKTKIEYICVRCSDRREK